MKTPHYIYKIALLILVMAGLIACEKDKNVSPMNQRLYFEYYTINYAWGLSYSHWIIDNEGNVRVNSKQDSIVWISENENEIDNYITCFDSVIYKIDTAELEQYISLIQQASEGKINCTDQYRADFGKIVFSCFWKNKVILLSSKSDIKDCSNLNNSANMIDNWLKSIQSEILSQK